MRFEAAAAYFALGLALAGCGAQPVAKSDNHIVTQPQESRTTANIPEPVRAIPLPPPPEAREAEVRYSVVVADQPVRDVLMAMARETKINFDIDPRVEGTVNLNAIDQTLKQILNRMAKQVDMRWETEAGTITVMRDTPYLRNYRVDYVNMARDVSETMGIATSVISGSLTGSTSAAAPSVGGSNNSTITITSTARHRFWETLERNIKDLLRETDKLLPEGSSETFVQNRGQSASATSQTRAAPPARRGTSAPAAGRGTVDGPGETQQATNTETVESRLTFREAASVIINAESGIVSVRGTSRQHEKVRDFLEQVTGSSKRQVLIEATIVEVTLNDNYQSGVDWSALAQSGLGYSFRQAFSSPDLPQTPFRVGTSSFSLQYSNPNAAAGGNISSTIRLLDAFGKTRVLSSPKLMVLNNQTAMLKVVNNEVYFTIQATTNQNQTQTSTVFTTSQNVVPVGFIMNVTPQISDADMVTLNVRPTVTSIIRTVNDPNPALGPNNPSVIPVTQTREMESVLKVASGQTAVLGGLMLDRFESRREGLPLASRIPLFGDLVSNRNERTEKSELVIFVRPTVVRDASVEGDLAGYRRFLPDRDFFRDTHPPFPKVREGIERMERGESPSIEVKAVPVVPDAPVPPSVSGRP